MKFVTLCSLLVVFEVSSLPIPADGDIKNVFDILPEEIKQFYQDLTEEDAKTFQSFESSNSTGVEILEHIKQNHPALSAKIEALCKKIADKIESLPDEPKKYLTSLVDQLKNARSADSDHFGEKFVEILSKGENLSKSAREEILEMFPSLKPLFDAEKN